MLDILTPIQQFFDIVCAALAAVFLARFFWGLVLYVVEGGDEEARVHAKRVLLGSSTALLLLMLFWSVLTFLHLTGPQFSL